MTRFDRVCQAHLDGLIDSRVLAFGRTPGSSAARVRGVCIINMQCFQVANDQSRLSILGVFSLIDPVLMDSLATWMLQNVDN